MQCSNKTFHFLSVSDGPTSILSDIVITLRKSHEVNFVTYFLKTKNACERCFWDAQSRLGKDIFFEICPRRLKDVTQKTSFLRCFWDVLKTSQKRHLFWDVSEMSLRYLSQWRSDWHLSETSHVGWERSFTRHFTKVLFTTLKYKKAFMAILKQNLRFKHLQLDYINNQNKRTEIIFLD